MKHDVRASQGPLDAIFMSRINSLIYTLLHAALEKEIHVWPLLDPPHLPPHQNNPCIDFLLLFQSGALHCHGLAQDLLHQLKLLCPLTKTRRSELVAPGITNSLIRAFVAWVPHQQIHSPPPLSPLSHHYFWNITFLFSECDFRQENWSLSELQATIWGSRLYSFLRRTV